MLGCCLSQAWPFCNFEVGISYGKCDKILPNIHAVDGINLVYPIIYKVLYIPGGAGVFPSIVGDFVTRFWCFGDL